MSKRVVFSQFSIKYFVELGLMLCEIYEKVNDVNGKRLIVMLKIPEYNLWAWNMEMIKSHLQLVFKYLIYYKKSQWEAVIKT